MAFFQASEAAVAETAELLEKGPSAASMSRTRPVVPIDSRKPQKSFKAPKKKPVWWKAEEKVDVKEEPMMEIPS